ncbi:MAG: YwaF family protein [Propionibacteriaceae bacterium]|jgi:hypothetical protein|nr:YwaF family protein [Propionibacteriaceae bacterium]
MPVEIPPQTWPVYPFGGPWFAYMLFLAAVGVGLHLVLSRFGPEGRRRGLIIVGCFNAVLFTVYTINLTRTPGYDFNIWTNLPLQFCSLVSWGIIPAAALPYKTLRGLCYFPGALGGFAALVSPAPTFQGRSLFSLFSLGFYGTHGINVIVSILLATLGLYIPSFKEAARITFWFVVGLCLPIFFLDVVGRAFIDPTINYFYFFDPEGAGILVALHNLIPITFVYEMPIVPVAYLCFVLQAGIYVWTMKALARRRGDPPEAPAREDGVVHDPGAAAFPGTGLAPSM